MAMATRNIIHLTTVFLLALALTFLFMSSSTPTFQFMAQGRPFPRLPDDANLRKDEEDNITSNAAAAAAVKERSWLVGMEIGSRPPRCDKIRYCSRNCGNCEAVQVPITLLLKPTIKFKSKSFFYGINGTYYYYYYSRSSLGRDNYISNYKPISWKCKCGDFIFNP